MNESRCLVHKYEIIKLYKEGNSMRNIAKVYNVSHCTISNILKSETDIRKKTKLDDEETLNKAIELYRCGMTLLNISKLLNVGFSTLKNRLSKRFDLDVKYRYEYLIESIKNDYESGLSTNDISKIYNISPQTVCNYLHLQKNRIRSRGEANRVYYLVEDYFNINCLTKEKLSDLVKLEKFIRFYSNYRVKITCSTNIYNSRCKSIISKFSDVNRNNQKSKDYIHIHCISSKNFYKNLKETFENMQNIDLCNYFIEEFIKCNLTVTNKYISISPKNVNRKVFRDFLNGIGIKDVYIKDLQRNVLYIHNLDCVYKLTQKYPFVLDMLKLNSEKELSKRFMIKYNI